MKSPYSQKGRCKKKTALFHFTSVKIGILNLNYETTQRL
jgi:hypothetical protein